MKGLRTSEISLCHGCDGVASAASGEDNPLAIVEDHFDLISDVTSLFEQLELDRLVGPPVALGTVEDWMDEREAMLHEPLRRATDIICRSSRDVDDREVLVESTADLDDGVIRGILLEFGVPGVPRALPGFWEKVLPVLVEGQRPVDVEGIAGAGLLVVVVIMAIEGHLSVSEIEEVVKGEGGTESGDFHDVPGSGRKRDGKDVGEKLTSGDVKFLNVFRGVSKGGRGISSSDPGDAEDSDVAAGGDDVADNVS